MYYFQAPCQVELENWVNSIHSACGAAFARHRGKIGTLHLLQEEIYRIEKQVEAVCIFKLILFNITEIFLILISKYVLHKHYINKNNIIRIDCVITIL